MKFTEGLLVLVIGASIGFGLSFLLDREQPEPITIKDTVSVKIDTNKLFNEWSAKIKPTYKYLPSKNDTVKDTTYLPIELDPMKDYYVSEIDTFVQMNDATMDLKVQSYSECPVELSIIDVFLESICKDSLITRIEYVNVEVPEPFYKDGWFYSTIGLGAVVVLFVIKALGG